MREVAAHQSARRLAVLGAGLAVQLGDLLEPAVAHGGGEGRDDQSAAEPGGQLDGGLGERGDVGGQGPLHRLRGDRDVLERVVRAAVRDRAISRPQTADQLHAFLEDPLVVLERHLEGQVFAPIVAATSRELHPASAQEIEGGPLFGDADRVMQRQHGDRGGQPDVRRPGGDVGQHEVGTGEDAEGAEVMLADPRGVHAQLLRVERLGGDVGDELVRRPRVVQIVVVAQREIAELHDHTLPLYRTTAMGGLERAPQAPRARRAPGNPALLDQDGGLERAPQAPHARRAPGTRGAPRYSDGFLGRPGGRSDSAVPDGADRDDYRRGEKAAGIRSLFSWRRGRTPAWGGHWPPLRDSSRMRVRSLRSL